MRIVLITIGLVGAGLLGAVFGQVLFPAEDSLPQRSEEVTRLTAEVEDLAVEVDRLRTEIRERRAALPLPADRQPAVASAPDATAPTAAPHLEGSAIDNASEGSAMPSLVTEDVIEEKVRETVSEIAREQREERARRAEADARAKEAAWLKEMQPHIGLTDYQVEEMAKLLIERRHEGAKFKRKKAALGADATPQEKAALQQEMADYGATLKAEVLKVVSLDQYEAMIRWSEQKRRQKGGRDR